jgi:ferritin
MAMSERLHKLLNDQITMELSAHTQYLAMAVYFEARSLDRLADFFYTQAEEEKFHALKIIHFLSETTSAVRFSGVPAPKQDFASAEEAAQLFVDQEQNVTESFYNINNVALEDKDYITSSFLQWFLDEQVEEMTTAGKLRDMIHMAGENLMMVELMIPDLQSAQSTGSAPAAPGA